MAVAGALVLLVSAPSVAYTQAPSGTITGIVADSTGAGVAGARVSITNLRTARAWSVNTSAQGIYVAAALLPGEYRVTVQVPGFKRIDRVAAVEAGTTTSVDFALELGAVTASVTVRGAVPALHYDHHQLGSVVRREQIENIPLNGRNFLELARVEPGVTSPVRGSVGAGNRTFMAILGSGLPTIPRVGYTRVTVDGASINALGVPGTSLQISSEIVQEFQLSTANFDVATSLTTNGAVNVVTRSGGNDYHGDVFGFYRDHHLSAYPGLRRDPRSPRPFFERWQPGTAIGGPLRRNRAFFFASYERNNQQGVAAVQPGASEFAPLGGIFGTPVVGDLFSARIDGRLTSKHAFVARHTRDTSLAFAGNVGVLPSGWTNQTNEAYQSVINVTSLLPREIVNDFRLSHFHLDSLISAADSTACEGCFGVGEPRISVSGSGLTFGEARGSSFIGRRYQLSENLVWQRGRHRLGFGFDWEHSTTMTAVPDADRLQITVWSPQRVRQTNQAAPDAQIPLPASYTTVNDVLQLPLRSFDISIGPGGAVERDFRPYRTLDMFRLYAADTWRVRPSLTVNVGLGWSYEPNALNHDLTKSSLLAPLLGDRGLDAPSPRAGNFSPILGIAWAATSDARTILRGGIGRYFDPAGSTNSVHLGNERLLLSPLGTGRLTVSGSNIRWNDSPLDFPQPTPFTAAQLLTILPGIRASLAGALNPENRDYGVRNIDRTKEGTNLYDPSYELPSAVHISAGIQRELASQFVLSTDVIWKRFSHTFINGIDYNRFNSAQGPMIPRCRQAERDDLDALCSNGPIMFDTTSGRAQYVGVLVRAEARIARRAQFLGSYALGSYVGSNGTTTGTVEMSSGRASGFNNDNWFENYGPLPTDLRHILNLSGYVELPWRFQVAFSLSATSRPPFTAWLEDVDINGDGTNDDLLPGTKVNELARGLDEEDLQRLVEGYNQRFADRALCCGQTAPRVTLPSAYAFNDNFFTSDVRITHTFRLNERVRLLVFSEVFNLFNTANLVQYSGNLLERSTFGQPAGRFTQIFGSGGPRAFQLGARISF
jgi:Carboxypeptidase regulatory-like domain